MQQAIPRAILDFAIRTHRYTVPKERSAGFPETTSQGRGSGDLCDLIGSLMVFDFFAARNRVCSLDITCGQGDSKDISIRSAGRDTTWNVKTSRYAPFRSGLKLWVKAEEVCKPVNGYMQVFVHLDEEGDPHVHYAGAASRRRIALLKIETIPNTGGHKGVGMPIETLVSLDDVAAWADEK